MKLTLFKLRIKHPPNTAGNAEKWTKNDRSNVLAGNPETACHYYHQLFPEAEILSCTALGKVDYLA